MSKQHQEIRLHGHLDETIEYFATAAAPDSYNRYFFEASNDALRFFSPGNEFILASDQVSHRGNGGSFCEYMFGVDQPLSDLAKTNVRNRLVLYGTFYNDDGSQLDFTSKTDGQSTYDQLFFEGNATVNYFFFVTGSVSGGLQEQQENIARLLGKTLKRSESIGFGDDTDLLDEIYGMLGHRSSLYLIKLINKKHRRYHDTFRELYFEYKTIPDPEYSRLQELADQLEIDRYQQERIRIDVMYKHPDNQRIVDEYKNILIECNLKGSINQLENARLTRLKTLSVRNKIPSALFYTLDKMLKQRRESIKQYEQAGRQELADQEALLSQRLTQASRVLELQRERASLEGQRARSRAEIAELRGQAAGNKIAMLQLQTRRREEAVTQLRDQQFRQIDLAERRIVPDAVVRAGMRRLLGRRLRDARSDERRHPGGAVEALDRDGIMRADGAPPVAAEPRVALAVLQGMLASAVGCYLVFKWKKWL